jgi:hypothetical protein
MHFLDSDLLPVISLLPRRPPILVPTLAFLFSVGRRNHPDRRDEVSTSDSGAPMERR